MSRVGPLIGPAVAIISFVCSIGNVPLAAVLWNGGISFGGVLSFIFADLIVLPILDIYRKYYGWRMAGFLLATFYATMVAAGLIVEFLFQALGIQPTERNAKVIGATVTWNYTTILNIIFLALAAVLLWRFVRTGGLPMLRMMNKRDNTNTPTTKRESHRSGGSLESSCRREARHLTWPLTEPGRHAQGRPGHGSSVEQH